MSFYRASVEMRKAIPAPLKDVRASGVGLSLFGATAGRRRQTDRELLKIDEVGPPSARLALDALAEPEGAAEWSVWGPVPGNARGRALEVKSSIMKAASDDERRALVKQAQVDGEIEIKRGHPWETMIRQGTLGADDPILWMPGDQMMALFRRHTQTVGEHCALIERASVSFMGKRFNIPIRLFPIVPTWLDIPTIRNTKNFTVQVGFGRTEDVRPEDLHWFRQVGMSNPYGRGVGPMQSLADDIELDEDQARYMSSLMKSVGQVRQIMAFPASGKSQEAIELELQRTRGPERASRLHLLFPEDPDAIEKIKQFKLGESPADLDVYKGRSENQDRILRTNRISPGAVGVARDVNRANAHIAREDLRASITNNLESTRRFHQNRYFEPLGDRPAEYAGEDRLFVMWHLQSIRDAETARILMNGTPEMYNQAQFWEMAGFEGGDSDVRVERAKVFVTREPIGTTKQPDATETDEPEETDEQTEDEEVIEDGNSPA